MINSRKIVFGLLAAFLLIVFFGGACDRDKWQDHLSKDDPILGPLGPPGAAALSWLGEWTMVSWWYQDDTGEIVEEEDHEGFVIYNLDGTCEFDIFGEPFSGTYEFHFEVSHTIGDDWLDGPWTVYLDIQTGEMQWYMAEDPSDPEGAGEGIEFEMEEAPTELWLGEWTPVRYWAQDENGDIVEEEEITEGSLTYNQDGSCELLVWGMELSGTFEMKFWVTHTFGDEWWDGPWYVTLTSDEMRWFTEPDPGAEGEGYAFEKSEE
jgi:hypothetical protein